MCCIFTCCGWMIDLVQRLWTFTMACCISSSVCCLLVVCSMSGVALGYNYSLAEYMELRETNVSIYMKRGVFDDEISDMEWRRSGHQPPRSPEESNLRSGGGAVEETSTTLRSGRRLDDSVVDTGDRNRYEGSLIKLTANPPIPLTPPPAPTGDPGPNELAKSFSPGSLDSLKAIQSFIDTRKSMANNYGLTTLSPVATYPFNELSHVYGMGIAPGMMGSRRNMQYNNDVRVSLSPARLAVPEKNIGEDKLWILPKYPELARATNRYYGQAPEPITYPPPLTLKTGPIRPPPATSEIPEESIFMTKFKPFTLFSTVPTEVPGWFSSIPAKEPTVESIKERLKSMNEMSPKRTRKPNPEEDYDYAIKGLPVRKRRSVVSTETVYDDEFHTEKENSSQTGIKAKVKEVVNASKGLEDFEISIALNSMNELLISEKMGMVQHENQIEHPDVEDNIQKYAASNHAEDMSKPVFFKQKRLSDNKTEMPDRKEVRETIYENKLATLMMPTLADIKKTFYSLAANDHPSVASIEIDTDDNDQNTVQPSHNLFITKIVSSNYNNPVSIAGFSTKQVASMEEEISNNVLNLGTIKSTPSVLVKLLLATIA